MNAERKTAAGPGKTGRRAPHGLLPLEVRGLCFGVGATAIINDIDLTLDAGGITVVMGPNGAGKSVFLRLLHGLLAPAKGTVSWNGSPPDEAVRKRQALVMQHPVVMRRSVAANIRFAARLRGLPDIEARIADVLELANLSPLAERAARALSGGEQQRLAMARALVLEPEILMLDEPTVSLDPAAVQMIEALICKARDRGTKIILVTHVGGQARRLGDDIVFLHKGRVIEHAPAGRFFKRPASPEARTYLAGKLLV